jgi:tRNA threonylcarbamoyladenosine biosynthesis protein TsaE
MAVAQGEQTVCGAEAMRALGREIGRGLRLGDVVLLHGDLGAGKTTLTQGIAEALGVARATTSPTFTLVTEHPATLATGEGAMLYHLDLYRLDDPEELGDIGWEEMIAPADGVTVVEWPERAGDWLPERYTLVSIAYVYPERRAVTTRRIPG